MQATLEQTKKRKPGPVAKGHTQYGVTLPPELGDWGKEQPEGLSGLVRVLLAEEKAKRESDGKDGDRVPALPV